MLAVLASGPHSLNLVQMEAMVCSWRQSRARWLLALLVAGSVLVGVLVLMLGLPPGTQKASMSEPQIARQEFVGFN